LNFVDRQRRRRRRWMMKKRKTSLKKRRRQQRRTRRRNKRGLHLRRTLLLPKRQSVEHFHSLPLLLNIINLIMFPRGSRSRQAARTCSRDA
jgi:hypothetical protein